MGSVDFGWSYRLCEGPSALEALVQVCLVQLVSLM